MGKPFLTTRQLLERVSDRWYIYDCFYPSAMTFAELAPQWLSIDERYASNPAQRRAWRDLCISVAEAIGDDEDWPRALPVVHAWFDRVWPEASSRVLFGGSDQSVSADASIFPLAMSWVISTVEMNADPGTFERLSRECGRIREKETARILRRHRLRPTVSDAIRDAVREIAFGMSYPYQESDRAMAKQFLLLMESRGLAHAKSWLAFEMDETRMTVYIARYFCAEWLRDTAEMLEDPCRYMNSRLVTGSIAEAAREAGLPGVLEVWGRWAFLNDTFRDMFNGAPQSVQVASMPYMFNPELDDDRDLQADLGRRSEASRNLRAYLRQQEIITAEIGKGRSEQKARSAAKRIIVQEFGFQDGDSTYRKAISAGKRLCSGAAT